MTTVAKSGSAGPQEATAKGLGLLSFALGVPQVLAPGRMNRMIGVRDDARTRMLMRAVGVREIASGVGIFSEPRPAKWLWARVAGDTVDLALLGAALRSASEHPVRTATAAGAVIGAFGADVLDSVRHSRATTPRADADRPLHVKAAVTVRCDPDELYRRVRDIERFPQFMAHVEEVTATSRERSRWKVRGPLGKTVEWDAVIETDAPGELLSWRSVDGMVSTSGAIRFVPAPGDRGTELHLEMRYDVPAGAIGATLGKLLGEEPAIGLKDDLRRLKQIVETGEIARSDGAPEGPFSKRTLKNRPATPVGGAA